MDGSSVNLACGNSWHYVGGLGALHREDITRVLMRRSYYRSHSHATTCKVFVEGLAAPDLS